MPAVANTRSLPTRELGTPANTDMSQTFFGSNIDAEEMTAALIWPNNLRVYDQMVREDTQVAAVIRAVTLPIRQSTFRVDPAGARPEVVQHIAEDLRLPVLGGDDSATTRRRGGVSWAEHVRLALLMLRYGHMFFEQLYEIDDAGMARLAKLSPRMPRSINSMRVASDGSLVSIDQAGTTIPIRRLVAYVHEQEGATWTGTSLLRPAYKHWLIKDQLLRTQAQTIERNGMGVPIYEGSELQDGKDLDSGLTMAKNLRSGASAGASVPAGAKLKLHGVEGQLPDAMEPINYHDQQIARACLAHFLNLGTQSSTATGSYNLGTQFADFFLLSLQTIADHLCDIATQHIVEDIVDVNWGPSEKAPRIVCDKIGSHRDLSPQELLTLAQAGVLFPDKTLDRDTRVKYGLPSPDYENPMPRPITQVEKSAPAADAKDETP